MAVLVGLQTTPLDLSHSLFPTSPSVLQSSITDSSHTNCVDYRTLACHADSHTVPYSWHFDCWPISSARRLAADWRLQALFLTANWLDDDSLPALQTNCSSTTTFSPWRLAEDSRLQALFLTANWKLTLLVSGSHLRWPFLDRVEVTYPNRSEMHSHGLVTSETSVVHSQCIAVFG
jgi:hypothetical protein